MAGRPDRTTDAAGPARDVVALVFGALLTAVAGVGLWLAFVGTPDWTVLRTVAPLGLVVVGVVGLVLSRRAP